MPGEQARVDELQELQVEWEQQNEVLTNELVGIRRELEMAQAQLEVTGSTMVQMDAIEVDRLHEEVNATN